MKLQINLYFIEERFRYCCLYVINIVVFSFTDIFSTQFNTSMIYKDIYYD